MGDWYSIGVALGIGVGCGVLLAALLAHTRAALVGAAVAAAFVGAAAGFAVDNWEEVAAGAVGGGLGALGTGELARGALRRGGTRSGTGIVLGAVAVLVAAAAFIPAVGYLLALAVPAVGIRLRRRAGERYAGLRTLARD